ncbi:hypothetical protein V7968_28080 [Nocardia vulneris]|uniref:hypothetical protein n=1 Tax=Nocardia vulneris TaxID=1141657 RepID=UPI0030D237E3
MKRAAAVLVAAFVPIVTAIVGLGAATSLIMLGTSAIEIPNVTTFLPLRVGAGARASSCCPGALFNHAHAMGCGGVETTALGSFATAGQPEGFVLRGLDGVGAHILLG